MTPNDAQIDLLLRRHAGQAKRNPATEQHLDADELNAFAEGSLPAAARSRYVSHLADCDDCRQVASQLAITSGAVVVAEAKTADSHGYSWWKKLSGFFSPLTLRYAAFAVVLLAVVGVVFLVTRRPREESLIAKRESANQPPVSAVKPAEPAGLQARADQDAQSQNKRPESASPAAATPMLSKSDAKDAGSYAPPPPPKPEPETLKPASPALAAEKAPEPKTLPSYAPAPAGGTTRSETAASKRQALPGEVAGGPRKSESSFDKFKMTDRSRAGDAPREARNQDDINRAGVSQPQANVQRENVQREADEKAARGRDAENQSSQDRSFKESQAQAPATQSARVVRRNPAEEAPETRSVGGRKFRKQGNSWVDTKFKSSMTLKSISRGSGEFAALDSGLRSIAQQISGEVIVVWKGKAYRID